MAKKNELPYRVISKPPEGYKLPDFFWEFAIKKAIEILKKESSTYQNDKY